MLRVLVCVFAIVLISSEGFSAEVKKVAEKTGAIYIDEGETSGFTKGSRVCFFEGDTKITCGKVIKAVKTKAIVKVPKSKVHKIHPGLTVNLANAGASAETPEAISSTYNPYSVSVGLTLHLMPMTPGTYNNIDYVAPAAGNTSLWETSSQVSSLIVPPGFGLEIELLNFGVVAGIRFGFFTSSSQPNTYDTTVLTQTLTTNIKATDLGVYFDYIFYKRWDLHFGVGVDFDLTSVTLSGVMTDDSDPTAGETELYNLTSSLSVFSLRVPVIYKYAFGSFGLMGSVNLLVPLFALGPNQSITSPTTEGPDTRTAAVTDDHDTDLSESLDHKKGTVAVDFLLGIFYQF